MAKQRGVVQLSGRVDNLCYYQQKRVRGGLVRRINLAMSERVKAGEEYVNLRAANGFFGACSMTAAAILNLMNKRLLYMTRADRQSYLTTRIYRHFVSTNRTAENFDATIINDDGNVIPYFFNSLMKVRARDFFISLPFFKSDAMYDATQVFTIPSLELEHYCNFFKGSEVGVNFYYNCYVYGSQQISDSSKYMPPEYGSTINRETLYWKPGDGDLELLVPIGTYEDTFSCCILRFDVVKYRFNERPVLLDSASTAHMISWIFD